MYKLERTKNAYKGIFTGILLKIFQIAMPFAVRTIIIYRLGMDYLGLNSLFTSVLQVLNLAELGVGSAMVFAMYRPIAEKNIAEINALLRLYKRYYRLIGAIIFVIGICIIPFLDKLISGESPEDINIYIIYVIQLFSTVVSYWLFSYKSSIIVAHQRNDVINILHLIVQFAQYTVQIVMLLLIPNYYVYIIILPIFQIISNILTAVMAKKMFPEYTPVGNLSVEKTRKINGSIKDLFTSKLGSVVLNSADSIVISAFLGLNMLAIYNNYYYIMSSVVGFITIILQSITAGIGNSFITETKEKNYRNFKIFSFMMSWVSGVCVVCFMCLYQPFINIWVGENNMLSIYAVVMLCAYFYLNQINSLFNTFKDAAGMWHEDRYRPITVALVNLGLNIISVQFIGIYGVILSTVVSILFIGMPWIIYNLFSKVFQGCSVRDYIRGLIGFAIIIFVASTVTYFICRNLPITIMGLFIRMLLCISIPNMIFIFMFRKNEGFIYMKNMVFKLLRIRELNRSSCHNSFR